MRRGCCSCRRQGDHSLASQALGTVGSTQLPEVDPIVWTKTRRSFATPRIEFHSPFSSFDGQRAASLGGRGVPAAAPQDTLGLVLVRSAADALTLDSCQAAAWLLP